VRWHRRPVSSSLIHGRAVMSRQTRVLIIALLATAVLSGCSNTATTSTNALAAVKPVAVPFSSSAVHGRKLPALYTCDGRNITPPLSWGAVPASVEELALFLVSTQRDKEGHTVLSIDWGLAGVKPRLHSLHAGEVPHGAFEVTDSNDRKGYSICPPHGQAESYSFIVFALPAGARATPSLSGTSLLRNLTYTSPQDEAPAYGSFTVAYKRR
jgi:phosphatidylethanolamine-binding protein (PEBP) family uncharacterized protein